MKGKIIGAILGGLTGGPWGAAIGLAAGHFYDSASRGNKIESEKSLDTKLTLLFYAVAKLAKVDGRISESEIGEIEGIFADLRLSQEMRSRAIDSFRCAKTDNTSFFDILPVLAVKFTTAEERETVFSIFLRIAFADGGEMNPNVYGAVSQAAQVLRVNWNNCGGGSRSDIGGNSRGGTPNLSAGLLEAYAILGVKPTAGDDDIKKTYRAKCKDLHPDTLRSKGIGEYAIEALQNELCRVNDAYDLIQKHRKG